MRAARLVVAEIRLRRRAVEFLGQQRHQSDYVGLLHHLRALRPLAANHHVDRHGAFGIGSEVERFQRVEAGELLIDAGRRIEADHDARDRVAPVRKLVVAKREVLPKRGGLIGPARLQQVHCLERAGDIPARHQVGECIVVHVLVVLVRPDHVANMPPAIRLGHGHGPGRPEPGSIQ